MQFIQVPVASDTLNVDRWHELRWFYVSSTMKAAPKCDTRDFPC